MVELPVFHELLRLHAQRLGVQHYKIVGGAPPLARVAVLAGKCHAGRSMLKENAMVHVLLAAGAIATQAYFGALQVQCAGAYEGYGSHCTAITSCTGGRDGGKLRDRLRLCRQAL